MDIPKIIHQSAPKDTSKWHPLWTECQKTWLNHFESFEYQFWDDERIDNFVREKFPQYLDQFNSCVLQIIKLDISRLMFLYEYGGIYSDMDNYCFKNFYDDLNGYNLFLVERQPWNKERELVTNSLIISSKKNEFILQCIENAFKKLRLYNKHELTESCYDVKINQHLVLEISGPHMVSETFVNYKEKQYIKILNWNEYNPDILKFDNHMKVKHMLTGMWGKNIRDVLIERFKNQTQFVNFHDFMLDDYKNLRSIDIKNYNVNKNYEELVFNVPSN